MHKSLKKIVITGGAGQIAYQLLFRIANGDLFGKDQPISLNILEVPEALAALEGVKMELLDCAFPLLQQITCSSKAEQAFEDVDLALLIGAKPRGPGMERQDLLYDNGKIFVEQGKALNAVAKKDAKVFVVGNPCNTNCLIAMSHAPRLCRKNFYAMTRLDQNRATFFLANKAGVNSSDITHITIWGNHSSTQVPDFLHTKIQGKNALEIIQDEFWLKNDFIELVRKRGAAIIQARGKSSAASAAQALIDAVRDRLNLTKQGEWFSTGIISDENPYNIEKNIIFSFPCFTSEKGISIISNLSMDEFLLENIKKTERELIEERDLIKNLINNV